MSTFRKCGVVLLAVVAGVGMGISQVRADIIAGTSYVQPVSAESPNACHPLRQPIRTIDGSGLNSSGEHSILWTKQMWESDNTGPATISFTLSGLTELTGMHVWNYNGDTIDSVRNYRSAKNVDVYVSADGMNFGASPTESFIFAEAPHLDTYAGEDYYFSAPVLAKAVKFVINSNFQYSDGSYSGLSEVRFMGTPTPEPSTVVLATTALIGLLAYAWRKRR